jgi:UDP-N-acetylmuramate: L-alanyl-gamma-D-glutamyl-meso-diaminopimelate ligase
MPYTLPIHMITNGVTRVYFEEGFSDLQVFGDHNLLNLHAARLVCNELGIADDAFLQSIATFKGAAKRLELVGKNERTAIYRDFAHAPSKVKATMHALQQQYPDRKLIAVLELHTYSSLNAGFMDQYQGAMDPADEAVVFYSKHALEIKRMPELLPEQIAVGFGRKDLHVFNQRAQLEAFLDAQQYKDTNLLLMSSGDYEGMDVRSLWEKIK